MPYNGIRNPGSLTCHDAILHTPPPPPPRGSWVRFESFDACFQSLLQHVYLVPVAMGKYRKEVCALPVSYVQQLVTV